LPAFPHELSGGMKQRVLIALALMLEPQMLILDEPTTALGILTQRSIIDLLRQLRQRLGFSMIFISHDLSIAAELADRMITMYAGRVVERARVEDMFYRPRHPYSLGLLRAVPRVSGALGSVASIPGSPPDLIRLPKGCSYAPRCPYAIHPCGAACPPRSLCLTQSDAHGLPDALDPALSTQEGTRRPPGPRRGQRAPRAGRPHATGQLRLQISTSAFGRTAPACLDRARAHGRPEGDRGGRGGIDG